LGRLLETPDRINFIAIDEAHLIFDWCGFRSAFGEVKNFKELFPNCPKIALSATLKPKHLFDMRNEVLNNSATFVGIIDRPNVSINMFANQKDSQK
jgi:superfamily II DNA helicase RecQ